MKRSVLPILAVLGLVWAAFACATAQASEAEGVVLCKTAEQPCKSSNTYPEGTAITAETVESSGPLKIATGSTTIECPSRLTATVGASSYESQGLSITDWKLGNPTDFCGATGAGSDSCGGVEWYPGVATAEGLPYSVEATEPGGTTVSISSELRWHLKCKYAGVTFIDCTYGYPGDLPLNLSEEHHSLKVTEFSIIKLSGSKCTSNPTKLSVTFRIVSPETPVYVSRAGAAPAVTTEKATHVKATSAKLNGTVNPNGVASTYWFEYGKTEAYGSKTSSSSAGSGSSPVAVSKEITGLTADTTYYYRLVAKNELGWESHGKDMTVGPPTLQGSLGKAGYEEDEFIAPAGIALDAEGNVWVADSFNDRIEKWSPSGEFLFAFGEEGEEEGQLNGPSALTVDSEGNLWVADQWNDRVEKFSDEGEFLLVANEEMSSPEGVTIDPSGNVWVSAGGEGRLLEFNLEGNWIRTSTGGGRFQAPAGIDFYNYGGIPLVYVADRKKNRIYEYTTYFTGGLSFIREWGKEGSGNGEFDHPDALSIDSEGNVWVTDRYNNRVQEFSESGVYITQFGVPLALPSGIATDSKGNIWVSRANEARVDRWSR